MKSVVTRWTWRVILRLTCVSVAATASVLARLFAVTELHHVSFNRHNLPDVGPFTRFEFPTVGHVYDADGRPLIDYFSVPRVLGKITLETLVPDEPISVPDGMPIQAPIAPPFARLARRGVL